MGLEEAGKGKSRNVLLPIRIDAVEPPFGFGMRQAGDFTGWNGKGDHPAFIELAAQIYGLLGRGMQPPPQPPPKKFPWLPVLFLSTGVLGEGGYYWQVSGKFSVGASLAGDSSVQQINLVQKESLAGQAPTATQPNVQPIATVSGRYHINGDGTVTDTKTNLVWKQCSEGQSGKNCTVWPLIGEVALYKTATEKDGNFSKPNDINTNFAGFSDWRMPTHEELRTCSNGTPQEKAWRDSCGKSGEYQQPTIDLNVFPNTRDWPYLSSSLEDKRYAWSVDFSTGEDDWDHSDSPAHVRLVRSGQ